MTSTTKGKKIKKKIKIYLAYGYWGSGGSTQYQYSKKEIFYLTGGIA